MPTQSVWDETWEAEFWKAPWVMLTCSQVWKPPPTVQNRSPRLLSYLFSTLHPNYCYLIWGPYPFFPRMLGLPLHWSPCLESLSPLVLSSYSWGCVFGNISLIHLCLKSSGLPITFRTSLIGEASRACHDLISVYYLLIFLYLDPSSNQGKWCQFTVKYVLVYSLCVWLLLTDWLANRLSLAVQPRCHLAPLRDWPVG